MKITTKPIKKSCEGFDKGSLPLVARQLQQRGVVYLVAFEEAAGTSFAALTRGQLDFDKSSATGLKSSEVSDKEFFDGTFDEYEACPATASGLERFLEIFSDVVLEVSAVEVKPDFLLVTTVEGDEVEVQID